MLICVSYYYRLGCLYTFRDDDDGSVYDAVGRVVARMLRAPITENITCRSQTLCIVENDSSTNNDDVVARCIRGITQEATNG